jgi:hypothetical protein
VGGHLVGRRNFVVDDEFRMGSFGNTSRGPDSVILSVEGDQDALGPLDRDGPVVTALQDMNVTIGDALAVPAGSAMQTRPSAARPVG